MATDKLPGTRIEDLVQAELGLPEPPPPGDADWLVHPPEDLRGLALSGGGVRSATYNLGLLQGLDRLGLLRDFHYVSTVSGGGYLGGFWTRWRHERNREAKGASPEPPLLFPERADGDRGAEAREVRHLREYSNFLAPRMGIFSYDTGRLLVTACSSMVPSLLAVFSLLVIALATWLLMAYGLLADAAWKTPLFGTRVHASTLVLLGLTAAVGTAFEVAWHRRKDGGSVAFAVSALVLGVALACAAWEVLVGPGAAYPAGQRLPYLPEGSHFSELKYLFAPCAAWLAAAAVFVAGRTVVSRAMTSVPRRDVRGAFDRVLARMLFLTASWTVIALLWCAGVLLLGWIRDGSPFLKTSGVTAVVAGLTALSAKIQQLTGQEASRPATGRFARFKSLLPQVLSYSAISIMVAGTAAFLLAAAGTDAGGVSREPAVALFLGAVGVTLGALLLFDPNEVGIHGFYRARLARAYCGASNRDCADGEVRRTEECVGDDVALDELALSPARPFPLICCAANDVASDGMTNLRRGARSGVLSPVGFLVGNDWAPWPEGFTAPSLTAAMTASGSAFNSLMGWRSVKYGPGVTFLMAAFNLRLGLWWTHPDWMRTQMERAVVKQLKRDKEDADRGAKRAGAEAEARAKAATQAAETKDPAAVDALKRAAADAKLAEEQAVAVQAEAVARLAEAEARIAELRWEVGVKRGTAKDRMRDVVDAKRTEATTCREQADAARSAASGKLSDGDGRGDGSVRTRAKAARHSGGGRRFWIGASFYRELFSRARADGPNEVHLSDGGHFENLAIYELIRRHCRVIVASDCGQDGEAAFDDLGNLVRKVRQDFGVDVRIDVSPLRPGPDGRARQHMVAGDVHYPDGDTGVLLLFKPALVGSEPADVAQYRARNAEFPHQTTIDQFYDEAQWEAYRRLGEHAALTAFRRVSGGADGPGTAETFARARREWLPAADGAADRIPRFTDETATLDEALREPGCRTLLREVYPELDLLDKRSGRKVPAKALFSREEGTLTTDSPAATLHTVRRALAFLFEVYQREDLERNHMHPLYLGVMNYFARWTSAPLVALWWPVLKAMYPQPFVRFLERRLGIPGGTSGASLSWDGAGLAHDAWERARGTKPEHEGRDVVSYELKLSYGGEDFGVQGALLAGRFFRRQVDGKPVLAWDARNFFVPAGLWGVGIGQDFLRRLAGAELSDVGEGSALVVCVRTDPRAGAADKKTTADHLQMYRSAGFREAHLDDEVQVLSAGDWRWTLPHPVRKQRPHEVQWMVYHPVRAASRPAVQEPQAGEREGALV
jgi:hypothetical protein